MGWMVGRHTEHTRAGGRTRLTARCAARGEVRVITPRSRGEHTKCASVGKHRNCSHARLHSGSQVMRECLESVRFRGPILASRFHVSYPHGRIGLFPSTFLSALMHGTCVASLPAAHCVRPPLLLCYTSAPRDTASGCARNTDNQLSVR